VDSIPISHSQAISTGEEIEQEQSRLHYSHP
jgi:hypothetical protein